MDESHILKFSACMDLPPQWNALSLDCSTTLKLPCETRVSQAANEPGTCNLYGAPTYVARWDLDVLIWGPFAPGIWRQDIQVCPAFRHATSIGTFGCDPCNEAHDIVYLHAYRSLSGDSTPSILWAPRKQIRIIRNWNSLSAASGRAFRPCRRECRNDKEMLNTHQARYGRGLASAYGYHVA